MYKISICGHFGGENQCYDGQTVKTQNIYEALKAYYGETEINKLDTYQWKKRPIFFLVRCIEAMKHSKNIIILPANNGVKVFVPLFTFLKKFFDTKIFYIVIGGWLPELLKEKKSLKKKILKLDRIFVETNNMKEKLEKQNIHNIDILVNFKNINIINEKDIKLELKVPYKLCTFSRIIKEKGIEDAIRVVDRLNENGNNIKYNLDIYGEINPSYKAEFEKILTNTKDYIKYNGTVASKESTKIIKNYDLLLFPTYYEGEGMAGTIIDAMFSGVPVIASNWKYNKEVIKNEYNGILYPVKNNDLFSEAIESVINNKNIFLEMKRNCINEAKKYTPENALKPLYSLIK